MPTLRALHKRLDNLERRANAKETGVLPIRTEIDLDTIEAWETLTPQERDHVRAQPADPIPATGDILAAIIVRVWLPDEDELWRYQDLPEPIKPAEPQPTYEPAMPTWEELRDAYVAKSRQGL